MFDHPEHTPGFDTALNTTLNTAFDTALDTLARTAADTARPQPAQTIRSRGAQRAMRHRIGGILLSIAVLAGIGVGTADLSPGTGTAPVAVSPSTPAGSAVDVAKYLPAAWLPADQYPLASIYHWTLNRLIIPSGEGQSAYACQTHGLSPLGLQGTQARTFAGTSSGWSEAYGYQPAEKLYFFATTAAARHAYLLMQQDWAGCQTRYTTHATATHQNPASPMTVAQTTSISYGSAWSKIESPKVTRDNYPDEPIEDHNLIVQRGPVVAVIWISWNGGFSRPAYDTAQDQNALHQMATRLAEVYSTP